MKFSNSNSTDYRLSDDILSIGQEAKKRLLVEPSTIDATVGALLDEQGKLLAFKTVENFMSHLDSKSARAYPPVDGGAPFKKSLTKWMFQQHEDALLNYFAHSEIATPGASGALSNVISTYGDMANHVLLPDIHWSNYDSVIKGAGSQFKTFKMFDGNHFNLADFKAVATTILETEHKLIFILNDPCHNPTGYSLSKEELKEVIHFLDQKALKDPVILIYDMAYLDYADSEFSHIRDRFLNLLDIKSNMITAICYSASKTFGIYGYRGGGLIGLSRNQTLIDEFTRITAYKARATWSCPPTIPVHILNHLTSEENLRAFQEELFVVRQLLIERSNLFMQEAKTVGLVTYPYVQGFFVTIPVKEPKKVFEALKAKNIFVIPLQNAIRVALSAVPKAKLKGLASIIKQTIEA